MLKLFSKFGKSDDGAAAIEFCMIFPIFITMFYGVVELTTFNMMQRRANMTANFSAEYLSRDDNNTLTVQERFDVIDMWLLVNSTAYETNKGSGRTAYISRGFQSIDFETTPGCEGLDCVFSPVPVFTFYWSPGGLSGLRPTCFVEVVGNDQVIGGDKIPAGMVGRSAIVTADYTYVYKPILENPIVSKKKIHVSSIRKTRGGTPLQHSNRPCV